MSFCTEPSREPSKVSVIRVGEQLVARLERLAEPLAQLAGLALELGADVVDLGRGALALEHAGADLDRVADRLRRRVPGLGALADEPGRALVVDGERLDHEAVADRADGPGAAAGGFVE